MNWNDFKLFIAIAQTRGLKKASNKLGIHHSSVARRIKDLEEQLGLQLFHRLPGGYRLTASGQELMKSAYRIQDEFNKIEVDMLGRDKRLEGDVCLTIPNGFALHLLMPNIQDFMGLYPDIHLKINMTYEMKDLANLEADVAIRHVAEPPESLAGKRVARLWYSAYASKRYLAEHDPIAKPQDCFWLGWGDAATHLEWPMKRKFADIPVRGDLYSDVLQLEAVKAGLGIASLPCYMADADPMLRRIPGAHPVAQDWIWVLAHKDMIANARVRALIDHSAASFDAHRDLIEGLNYTE